MPTVRELVTKWAFKTDGTAGVDKLNKGIEKTKQEAVKAKISLQQMGKSAGELGRNLRNKLTLPIMAFATAGFMLAETTEKIMKRLRWTFGDSSQVVIDWAKKLSTQWGVSGGKLREQVTSVGLFLTNLGIQAGEAAKLSMALVERSREMAARTGQDAETYQEAFMRAMSGRVMGLKRLGISITEADQLEWLRTNHAVSYTRTLKKAYDDQGYMINKVVRSSSVNIKKLSEEQKARMIMSIILQKTQRFMGSMNDTQNEAGRVTERVSTAIKSVTLEFGKLVLEAIQPHIPKIEKMTKKIGEMRDAFAGLSDKQKESVVQWGALLFAAGPALILFEKITIWIAKIKTALYGASVFLSELPISLAGALATPLTVFLTWLGAFDPTIRSLGDLIDSLQTRWENTVFAVKKDWSITVAQFKTGISNIKAFFSDLGQSITDMSANAKRQWQEFVSWIVGSAKQVSASIHSAFAQAFDTLPPWLKTALKWITDHDRAGQPRAGAEAPRAGAAAPKPPPVQPPPPPPPSAPRGVSYLTPSRGALNKERPIGATRGGTVIINAPISVQQTIDARGMNGREVAEAAANGVKGARVNLTQVLAAQAGIGL